jgi:hypothetical protein
MPGSKTADQRLLNDRDYSSSASILEKMTLCMLVSGSRTRRGRKSERPG